jgi:hypothetical protein
MSDREFEVVVTAWLIAALVLWVPFPYLFDRLFSRMRAQREARRESRQKRNISSQAGLSEGSVPTES